MGSERRMLQNVVVVNKLTVHVVTVSVKQEWEQDRVVD